MALGLPWILKMSNKPIKQPARFHSLSRRIVAQFCIFTLVLSAIYGLLSFLLMYILEDEFIVRDIRQEANYLLQHYQQTSQWPQVQGENMTLHFSLETLPDDVRQKLIEEPLRTEFYGANGRHYHLYPVDKDNSIYLLAEVSQKLLVRPIREGVITLLIVGGSILTLIAFFIAWMLGRKTALPLKKLADLVDGVAPEKIPEKFADQYPNNEIGILATRLENTMQQLSQALEREKCFTRDVSHELRTPVAVIKNAAEVYRQKNIGDAESSEIINRITDATIQMEQTVITLLTLAREEHTSVGKSSVKLLPIIEQSILDHGYLLEGKDVDVEVSDNCDAEVFSQKGMVKVLLDNLLSNAFQYTNSGVVTVNFTGNTLTIEDTGPGIEGQVSANVTEPAVKGSQSTGYGFGLSIVKRLCEHQNWHLTVSSHQGTTVQVLFG